MENFYSAYQQGFVRVAACSAPLSLGNPTANVETIVEMASHCAAEGVGLAVFPELCLTGYSIGELLIQDALIDAAEAALLNVAEQTKRLLPVIVVGLPMNHKGRVYNCAAVLHRGNILGIVPKTHLAQRAGLAENRYFSPGYPADHMTVGGINIPFGNDLLFSADDLPGFTFHVEIGADTLVPLPPSTRAVLAGATVLVTPAAFPATIGGASDLELLSEGHSLRNIAAHVLAAAGDGESSTDYAWAGHSMINEVGMELASSEPFGEGVQVTRADVDLVKLAALRRRTIGFISQENDELRTVPFELDPPSDDIGLLRTIPRYPYVSDDPVQLAEDCTEAFNIQVSALAQRMRAIGLPKIVLGVSGGLDSTQALLVAARTMDLLDLPRTHILAFTMPGFATSDHTKNNAIKLSEALGVTFEEIDIKPVATQMLTDMGHPFGRGEEVYDVTFENVQAGLRTDYLFRLANARGGIVLGTGDFSELALGWATYGVGDQMSHFNVNPGMPKTLMQQVLRWLIATEQFEPEVCEVIESIVNTEISPELVPASGGNIQSTQGKIGPYALQDFNAYCLTGFGLRPSRIAFLAMHAWKDADAGRWPATIPAAERHAYSLADIKHWLELFIQRFFTNQFKRSALPNGPKIHSYAGLSPRGEWAMPADMGSAAWQADLARIPDEEPTAVDNSEK